MLTEYWKLVKRVSIPDTERSKTRKFVFQPERSKMREFAEFVLFKIFIAFSTNDSSLYEIFNLQNRRE